MEIITLSTLALASAINSAIPGPCIALTIGRSARSGMLAGLLVTGGIVLSDLILCGIAISVVQGVLAVSQSAFVAFKWIGIAALIALALRILASRDQPGRALSIADAGCMRDLGAGLAVGLSSPFNLIFLLALLPQLIPTQNYDIGHVVLIVAAVLTGSIGPQIGAVLIGIGSVGVARGTGGGIERLGALSIIGFAVVAVVTPIA